MGGGDVTLDPSAIGSYSATIADSAAGFGQKTMASGGKTTLTAVKNAESAFSCSQAAAGNFGRTLTQDAKNIRSVCSSFQKYEARIAAVIGSGGSR